MSENNKNDLYAAVIVAACDLINELRSIHQRLAIISLQLDGASLDDIDNDELSDEIESDGP